ncbi:hypothetical protein AVEN_198834-1 [Araneus ventricosus]|uniref:Ionotropic glutamate receptor L-glutamate and glycine-binding domain-containing protein n=1 Tax=Araneus ventricosus TaxID=182803 RepID=A0A4Y2UW40_ARAVE|nr:hypothetical protein AVEN_198834-1 [Araneus ventricosus]
MQAKFLYLIVKALNKPFEVVTFADGEVGRLLSNGSWTGTIGEIQMDKADFAINYMTISEQRLSATDFNPVYATDDLTFTIRKPGETSKSLALVYPFHSTIWITGFIILLLMPLVFLFLLRIQSPYIHVLLKLLGQYTFKNLISLRYKIITFTRTLYGMI